MMIDSIHSKECLIFGCGNPLFGDDGFGPGVIEHLQRYHQLPEDTACMDAGTAVRDILFDILLSEKKPRQIVIVDASEQEGILPGVISEIDVDDISIKKTSDFSLHQFPTTNMLKELKMYTNVDIRVLVVQPEYIPEQIEPGISEPVAAAVPEMCRQIMAIISKEKT
jgi:coenzyme F420 hydrogenase subunit delta